MNIRAKREIEHGKYLATSNPETAWGWGTPAGRLRAQRRANLIATGARLGPGLHVLEIGCGTGMFTEIFARTGAYIVAVDISASLLEKAKARNLPEENVCFVEMRFEDCDLNDPFDAVIGSSILHHLEYKDAINKIFQLLKPNGIMSFAEPNMLNPQVFAERKFRELFPYVSPDETAFMRWMLKKVLQNAEFQNIKIIPFDWLHPLIPHTFIGTVSALGQTLEKIPLLCEFSGSLYIKACRPSG